MPAPTVGTPLGSVYNTTTKPKTAGAFTLAVGDILVVVQVFEDNPSANPVVPTCTTTGTAALTFTKAQEVTTASNCRTVIWYSQTVGTAGTYTVSASDSSSNNLTMGCDAWPVSAHGGAGTSNKATGTASGPSVTLTGVAANSAIFMGVGDWSAAAIATRAYRTTDAGTYTERTAQTSGTAYSTYSGVYANAGSAANKVVGMTAPNQTWGVVGLEILGTGGAAAPPYLYMAPMRR